MQYMKKMQIYKNMDSNIFWFIRMKYEFNYDTHHPHTSFFQWKNRIFIENNIKENKN